MSKRPTPQIVVSATADRGRGERWPWRNMRLSADAIAALNFYEDAEQAPKRAALLAEVRTALVGRVFQ